jgi:hypothetical protein
VSRRPPSRVKTNPLGKWESYDLDGERFNLHDFVKAYCVHRGIPTQFLREYTLTKPICGSWRSVSWRQSLPLHVCDVCGSPATETVTFRVNERSLQKDLCQVHLAEITAGARASKRGRRAGSVSTSSNPTQQRATRGRKSSSGQSPSKVAPRCRRKEFDHQRTPSLGAMSKVRSMLSHRLGGGAHLQSCPHRRWNDRGSLHGPISLTCESLMRSQIAPIGRFPEHGFWHCI